MSPTRPRTSSMQELMEPVVSKEKAISMSPPGGRGTAGASAPKVVEEEAVREASLLTDPSLLDFTELLLLPKLGASSSPPPSSSSGASDPNTRMLDSFLTRAAPALPSFAVAALDSSLQMDGGAADRAVVSPTEEPDARRVTVVTVPLVSNVTTDPFFSSVATTAAGGSPDILNEEDPVLLRALDPAELTVLDRLAPPLAASSFSSKGRVDIRRRPGTGLDGSSLISVTVEVDGSTAAAPFLLPALLVGTRVGHLGVGKDGGLSTAGGEPAFMLGHLGGGTAARGVVTVLRSVLRFLLIVVVVVRLVSLVGISYGAGLDALRFMVRAELQNTWID